MYTYFHFAFICFMLLTTSCSQASENEARGKQENRYRASTTRLATQSQSYKQECSACHLAYPAQMLPKQSWQTLMQGLDKHFGTNAEITDNKTIVEISNYLQSYARTDASIPAEHRITQMPWFIKEHHEIAASTWLRASVQSKANCVACHQGAAQGDFDEDAVRIPR